MLYGVSLYQSVVAFEDENLEAAVRKKLERPNGLVLRTDLLQITHLDASGHNISHLGGIEYLRDLVSLNLENNKVENLKPLRNLNKLSRLNISYNQITDLESVNFEALQELPLRRLNLSHNRVVTAEGDILSITDMRVLMPFSSLERLDLSGNLITDITPLRKLKNLNVLNLRDNRISDIDVLKNLKNLRELNLRDNRVADLRPLAGLNDLTYLNIHSNKEAVSLQPLSKLTGLQTLIMRNIPIGEEVGYLRNLTNLERLNVRNCGIIDTSVLLDMIVSGAFRDNPKTPERRSLLDVRDNPLDHDAMDAETASCETWITIDHRFHYLLPSACRIDPPVFSHSGGFFPEPFHLTISHPDPDVTILYTLDGSYPDINNLEGTTYMYKNQYPMGPPLYNRYKSHNYSGPIEIYNRSAEPDKITQIASTPFGASEYIPQNPVQKGTVVRAIAIKGEAITSIPETHTFFVDSTSRGFNLPTISVAVQEDNLFDYFKGIYTAGYDADLWSQNNPGSEFTWFFPGNYNRRGFMWEYPANFEFFPDKDHHSVLNQKVGLRIHGGGTRSFPMKSMRIYARDFFGYPDIKYPFFGEDITDSFKTLILRNSGNDFPTDIWGPTNYIGTMFRDAAIQKIMKPLNLDTQGYNPVIFFMNGEYWGIHNIRERYDKYYLEANYGVDPNNIDLLTSDSEVKEGDDVHYKTTLAYIKKHGLKEDKHYDFMATRIDIENFTDFQIANIFAANTDWPGNNNDYWRLRTTEYMPESGYGHDGRWRWMLYDTDFGFGLWSGSSNNTLAMAAEKTNVIWPNPEWSTFLFRSFLENDSFRSYFINRFADLLNTVFLPENMIGIINRTKKKIEQEMSFHLERWKPDADILDWYESVDVMIQFSNERPDLQREQIRDFFDLDKNLDVTLNVSNPKKGHIRLNTLKIMDDTVEKDGKIYPWEGIYFKDIPIELEAVPLKNYRFVGWLVWQSELPEPLANEFYSTEPVLKLTPDTNTSIKAVFR